MITEILLLKQPKQPKWVQSQPNCETKDALIQTKDLIF